MGLVDEVEKIVHVFFFFSTDRLYMGTEEARTSTSPATGDQGGARENFTSELVVCSGRTHESCTWSVCYRFGQPVSAYREKILCIKYYSIISCIIV
jgi:hypothetical protein